MELNEIKYLLERFYKGESTLVEEEVLTGYFTSHKVPEELIADKETFLAMAQLSAGSAPDIKFSKKLEEQIDNGFEQKKIIWLKANTRWLVGVAASILLLVSIFVTNNQHTSNWKQDTYSDPEVAYQETMKVLNYISSTMNRSTSTLNYFATINKSLKPVDLQFLKRKENENKNYNSVNPDNDLFYGYIASKWPGVGSR